MRVEKSAQGTDMRRVLIYYVKELDLSNIVDIGLYKAFDLPTIYLL